MTLYDVQSCPYIYIAIAIQFYCYTRKKKSGCQVTRIPNTRLPISSVIVFWISLTGTRDTGLQVAFKLCLTEYILSSVHLIETISHYSEGSMEMFSVLDKTII